MSKKVLLTNSYAVNNGDMALVIAVYNELKSRNYDVSIATFYYDFLKSKYPDLPLIRELLDHKALKGGTFIKKIFLKLNFLTNRPYRGHDIFIASPGGYMNSYYGLKRCLLPLVEAKKRGKKTAVYSQSVGPLNTRDQKLFTKFSRYIDVILVRDDYSKNCVSKLESYSKIFQTKDAAFLLPPRKSNAPEGCRRVAVSVREWKFDNRDMTAFSKMVILLCNQVIDQGYEIEFISTCQGVENYRDDSRIAEAIRKLIVEQRPDAASRISVDVAYHTLDDLMDRLNTRYCFTIGTRLHMCILSLINGTPAFNISYEVKGVECFRYLGLEDYSVDFNEPAEMAMKKFGRFLGNHESLRSGLLNRLLPVHQESKRSMDQFLEALAPS